MRHKRLLTAVFGAFAFFGSCIALSPSFSGEDPCPFGCAEAGISPGNWTVYHSVDRLSYCKSSLILFFSAFSPLDDPNIGNTLRTCALYYVGHNDVAQSVQEGHARTAASTKSASIQTRSVNGSTSLNTSQYAPARALWNNESPTFSQVNIPGPGKQLQSFLDTMNASDEGTAPKLVFIYDSLSSKSIGIYAGTGVPTSPLVSALSDLATSQRASGGALIQACNALPINNTAAFSVASSSEDGSPFTTAVGIVTASGPYSLAKAQRAVRQWASSSCVAEEDYAQASPLPTTLQTVD